jgi:O-antigen ligase
MARPRVTTLPWVSVLPAAEVTAWTAGAIALGLGVGLAAALGQAAIALAIVLAPALIALLLHPEWLPAVLVASAFGEALSTGSLTLSRLAAPLAVLIMVLALPGRSRLRLRGIAVPAAVAVYCLWALASALWTVNPDSSLHQGGTGYALASLGLSLVYMLAIAMFVQSERDVRRLLVTVWSMSVLAGTVSIVQYLSGYSRALGLSGDANFFAALQVIVLPLEVVLANYARRGAVRMVVLAGIAVTVGSIMTSLSRGGILALGAVFALTTLQPARTFFRTRAHKRAFLLVVALGTGVLLLASYSALSARASSLFYTADGGSGRTNLWLAALHGFSDHKLAGIGFGSFLGQSNRLLLQTPGVDFSAYVLRPTGQFVHNAYLESLVELGVVGLALFLALLGSMTAALLRASREAARRGAAFLSSFTRALLLSVAGFALTSIFLSTETDRTLWILLGLSIAMPRVLLKEQPLETITRKTPNRSRDA